MSQAVRESDHGAVRRLTLCRPDDYNTITPAFRDELGAAIDAAQRDRTVRVILLDAEGPAFCAGYGLDWSTARQAEDHAGATRVWDTPADLHLIGPYAETWAKLHDSTKPTIAAVQGWCIAGGTNVVFNAHMIVAAESARFGYPPSRVWGVPEAPWNWVARMGLQNARRYMLTGDEFSAAEALAMGAILDVVPDVDLATHAMDLAQRVAQVPSNQLEMITMALNAVADHQFDPPASRRLGTIFDGVARHSQEGMDFVARSSDVGFREAVRERDRPFRDYGERPNGTGSDESG
ncbi:MAG: enoyl-CoA hydratase-related protein [Acidimicrobiales bacterium]